ncbi:MAG: hypothetical protein KF891_04660 [Rhizobacter sp.]|nr:hypothetical protein [Rhizobacter sp.]
MRTLSPRRLLTCLALAGALVAAVAPARADELTDCPVTPFAEATALQYQAGLEGQCRTEDTRWLIETPRAKPSDVGPSLLRAEFSSLTSVQLPFMVGSMRFDWSGLRGSEAAGSPRSERAALALGGLVHLLDNLAVQTRLGLEYTDVQRSRATVSGVWQPIREGVLFAEWAGSEAGTEGQRVGGRWWVVPEHLSIDVGARYLPDGTGWVDERVALTLDLPL